MADSGFTSFLAGAFTTVLGATLVMIWDFYKIHKDTIDRETKILNAVRDEVITNQFNAEINLMRLTIDINGRTRENKDREIIEPIIPFCDEMLTLAKFNFSQDFLNYGFLDTAKMSSDIDNINEISRSRENYRLMKASFTGWNERIIKYDEILLIEISSLSLKLSDLRQKLEQNIIRIKADEAGAYYA